MIFSRGVRGAAREIRRSYRAASREDQARFETHARLLSSGFHWRIYAFSASERASSFRIAEDDDDDEEED